MLQSVVRQHNSKSAFCTCIVLELNIILEILNFAAYIELQVSLLSDKGVRVEFEQSRVYTIEDACAETSQIDFFLDNSFFKY